MSTLFWGYFSRISSIASSLIIMPFALAQFTAEAFSIWMIFVTFYGLIVVFDFGLTTTISRQYNYILSGATSIEKHGLSEKLSGQVDEELFSQLYLSSKKIFSGIAVAAVFLLIAVYVFYLQPVTAEYDGDVAIEWLLYAVAIILNLFCLAYNAIFFGTNNVASIYRVCSITNIVFFIFAITLILLDYGLLAIAIARFLSAVVYYLYAKVEINKHNMLLHYHHKYAGKGTEVLKNLVPNAAKLGGVTLGNFLVSKASVLIVAAYLPLAISGSYSLSLNIFSVIMSVSLLFMTIKTPQLNSYRQEKKYNQLLSQQKKVRLICLLTASLAFIAFMILGKPLLVLINSSTQLPSIMVLTVFSMLCFLEVNRLVSMNFIMTSNNVPFLKPVLLTGAVCILLTIGLFELGYRSLMTPVLIQLMLQCFFNNWYWTKQEFNECHKLAYSAS